MNGEFFEVKDLTAGYGEKEVLNGVSFTLSEGEVCGVIGTNGSGKTTLLKALCGILPSQGEITFQSENLLKKGRKEIARICGYIPQRSGITISLSVMDAVLMGFSAELSLFENPTPAMHKRAEKVLSMLGLSDLKERDYLTLSEGQKQMVILARTLVSDRKILFLDEPESSLDFSGRYRMMQHVRDYVLEKQASALLVLHDPNLALSVCDRILLLKDGMIFEEIHPKEDDEDTLTEKLSAIYGPVSVHRLKDARGVLKTVLLS